MAPQRQQQLQEKPREVINVTKPFLPDRARLNKYIDSIYETNWLTNNGPLVQELTRRLEDYLGIENLLLVTNGTLALQVAYKTLGIAGEAITTPFSFVATASTLAWEGIEPVFADIDPETFCLGPDNIKPAITPKTTAIVPVHVFGNACECDEIEAIAKQHGLKVIYDAAHAFGVKYKGENILKHGDAATLSFHATKVFHTIEGGAIVFKKKEDLKKAKALISFGMTGKDSYPYIGINAKMNEFQAAMGLAVLDQIDEIFEGRGRVWKQYEENLKDHFQLQKRNPDATNNYAYLPIVFESQERLLETLATLNENAINPRRYFYPSLDTLPWTEGNDMAISRDIAKRILCLPIYPKLSGNEVEDICGILLQHGGEHP